MADKKKYDLDDAQKEAVKININSVVSAGAGSGKTSVLAKRFVDILKRDQDCGVDQILTLTFTKKATVEMTGRIYEELAAECKDKAADFYKANIKTLDSYCSQVARLGCHYYGVSPDFAVDEDAVVSKVNSMALPFILKYRDNRAVKALVNTNSFESIAGDLFASTVLNNSTIVEKIDFEKDIAKQKNEIRTQWKKLYDMISGVLKNISSGLEGFDGNKNTKFFQMLCLAMEKELPEMPVIDFDEPVSISRNELYKFLEGFSSISLKGNLKNYGILKDSVQEMRGIHGTLNLLENYIYGNQFVKELVPLLEEFQNKVNDMKRSAGILSYSDVSSLAKVILIEHPEIRLQEKKNYRYIMIDEFQDNNQMQRDLLFLLSEKYERMEKSIPQVDELLKEKLFFVGDEKQSIYRFRGADVSVFRGLSDDFKDGNLELKTNYRSKPALIAAFNTIFGGVPYPPSENESAELPCAFYTEKDQEKLRKENDSIPMYEAVYHNVDISKPAKEEISTPEIYKKTYKPRVHFALYDQKYPLTEGNEIPSKPLSPDECEAYWVVNKIKKLLGKKEGDKIYDYNSFAILFRSYKLLPVYEKVFLNEGIPYTSETVKGFYNDGPVNDMMSFLRLVAYPNDSLSFANILRSPFINLSAAETSSLLAAANDSKKLFSLEAEGILCDKSLELYNEGKEIFFQLEQMSKHLRITDLISFLWYEKGYRYETLWNKKVYMYNSIYDRLFELARQADLESVGIAEFVDSIDDYQDEGRKLEGMEIPLESAEGVHFLSIHKSKGLEYPVVFICGAGHKGANDSNQSCAYSSKEFGLTINTPVSPVSNSDLNYFFEMQRDLTKKMTAAELRRLTYVAITRAEHQVYITGSCNFEDMNDYSPAGGKIPYTLLDVLKPSLRSFLDVENNSVLKGAPFTLEIIPQIGRQEILHTDQSKVNKINKLSELYSHADLIEKEELSSRYVSPSHLHDEDDEIERKDKIIEKAGKNIPFNEIDEVIFSTCQKKDADPEFSYADFGTIAHAHMEAAVKNQEPPVLSKEYSGLHDSKTKISLVEKCCQKMKETFLESELGKSACDARTNGRFCKSEYSFKSIVSSKIVNGQIDLVFENDSADNKKRFTIVDYKTNREIQPEIYFNQLACYRQAVSRMLGVEESQISCFLYYLRYGKAVDITLDCDSVDIEKAVKLLS